jgi:hypothetical protein
MGDAGMTDDTGGRSADTPINEDDVATSHSFRLPDGVEYVGDEGDNILMRVEIPLDDDGFFGRQCPSCNQVFRVSHDDYEALPDDLCLWCVYCGHHDDHSEFLTDQQKERILRPAADVAMQLISQALDDSFGGLARRTHGSMVSFSYRSSPFYPEPLPGIDEERLIRERSCLSFALRYAVFGEHRFCPVCGALGADVVAADALAAERARLDALGSLPADSAAQLREQGVFHRICVDTIENLVSIVENLASSTFRTSVPGAEALLKGKGNVFQRLDDMADLFQTQLDCDLRSAVNSQNWSVLGAAWAARHVFGHRDGIVDDRYLVAVPTATVTVGQRLTVSEASVRQAIDATTALCEAISSCATRT